MVYFMTLLSLLPGPSALVRGVGNEPKSSTKANIIRFLVPREQSGSKGSSYC